MISGSELSRLIQAALPLPGSKVDRDILPSSLSALAARNDAGGPGTAIDAALPGAQLRTSDMARSALERALVNHTLASSLASAHDAEYSARNPAQPYLNAIADRTSTGEPNPKATIDLPARLTPEPAFTLNPALSLVAAELTRTLQALPSRIASDSGQAGARIKSEAARTSVDEFPHKIASRWPARILSVAAALVASAIAVWWLAHVLRT